MIHLYVFPHRLLRSVLLLLSLYCFSTPSSLCFAFLSLFFSPSWLITFSPFVSCSVFFFLRALTDNRDIFYKVTVMDLWSVLNFVFLSPESGCMRVYVPFDGGRLYLFDLTVGDCMFSIWQWWLYVPFDSEWLDVFQFWQWVTICSSWQWVTVCSCWQWLTVDDCMFHLTVGDYMCSCWQWVRVCVPNLTLGDCMFQLTVGDCMSSSWQWVTVCVPGDYMCSSWQQPWCNLSWLTGLKAPTK